jgi:hypothetical protein
MQYYWYNQVYTKLPVWSDVKAAKLLTGSKKYLKIKLAVSDIGHQIDIQTSPGIGFTQIFAENLPIKLMMESEFFDLDEFSDTSFEQFEINPSIKLAKFKQEVLENFLKTESCIFYSFPDESWRVLRWELSENSIEVKSLHAFPTTGLCIESKSEFSLT